MPLGHQNDFRWLFLVTRAMDIKSNPGHCRATHDFEFNGTNFKQEITIYITHYFCEAKLKSNRLLCLVEETSTHYNLESVDWLFLIILMQVYKTNRLGQSEI